MRRGRAAAALALGVLAGGSLAGCGALRGPGAATLPGAHVLFLVRPACPTVVARTLAVGRARAFTVLHLEDDDYAPHVGDLLEGPAREGEAVFTFHPPESADTHADGRPVAVDVLAVGLGPEAARARLDAACGLPPLPAR